MQSRFDQLEVDDDVARIDFAAVHAWLAGSYWSPGVERERVEQAARFSALVVGAYFAGKQVGYVRVVSDRTTFAWIADVFVDPAHRGRGIARAMVRFALEHPNLQGLRRWMLATRDAHGVYAAAGFRGLEVPGEMMIFRPRGDYHRDAGIE